MPPRVEVAGRRDEQAWVPRHTWGLRSSEDEDLSLREAPLSEDKVGATASESRPLLLGAGREAGASAAWDGCAAVGGLRQPEGHALTAALLQVINRSSTELPLTVAYDKISLGRLRFWIHMQDAVYSLQQFGERRPGRGRPSVRPATRPSAWRALARPAVHLARGQSTGLACGIQAQGVSLWPGCPRPHAPTCSAYSAFPLSSQGFRRKTQMKSKAFSSTPTCTS